MKRKPVSRTDVQEIIIFNDDMVWIYYPSPGIDTVKCQTLNGDELSFIYEDRVIIADLCDNHLFVIVIFENNGSFQGSWMSRNNSVFTSGICSFP